MSDQDLQTFFALVTENPDVSGFDGPRPHLVQWIESELGVVVPPQYRLFIETLGVGHFGSEDFAGPVNGSEQSGWPDVVATARFEQTQGGMPSWYLPVMDDGMGGKLILDTLKTPEPPVEVWTSGSDQAGDELEQLYEDFGAMAVAMAREYLEDPV